MTLANFNESGTTPVENDRLNIYVNGLAISKQTSFNIVGPMLSIPADLLFLKPKIIFSTSFASTGLQNIL